MAGEVPFPIADEAVVCAFPEFVLEVPPLGTGGMKTAYRTEVDGEPVALKVVRQPLPIEGDGELVTLPERLMREVVALRSIEHPRIVRILAEPELREIDGALRGWFLEPYYQQTVDKCLAERWPVDAVVQIISDLVEGVTVLREHGIVHRDIKPANIALDADGRAVLLDLGIALFVDLTPITDPFGGSPRTDLYAAPEQFLMRETVTIDWRTDLFQVGIVAYEVLTGEHPFQPNHDGYFERLRLGNFNRSPLERLDAPEPLQQLLARLLAPRPAQRFRAVEHVQQMIEDCR